MTAPQPIDAPRPGHSTGPRTPQGKRRCSLKRRFHSSTNAYRHGLTGQRRFNSSTKICILTPDEQQAYDKHSSITLEALAPAGDFERDIALSIADDRWRLKRARTIESGLFAIGMQQGVDDTGSDQVDDALAQARTWSQEARNLNLLTIYAQRIQRSVDKNMAQLEALQTERKEVARESMRQAKLLYRLAQAEGRPYQPKAFFTTAPEARESVFSTPEVAREVSRAKLLDDAKIFDSSGNLPKKAEPEQPLEAAAGQSVSEFREIQPRRQSTS